MFYVTACLSLDIPFSARIAKKEDELAMEEEMRREEEKRRKRKEKEKRGNY